MHVDYVACDAGGGCGRGATVTLQLPDYWLTRPVARPDERAELAFDRLWSTALATEQCAPIDYTLPWPKWQFVCHLGDRHDLAWHGSGDASITELEPRQSNDLTEFGNQKAVYAAADGLWAMFFAIVDRSRVRSITNACVRLEDETGIHGPFYVFSVSQPSLATRPWRTGTLYVLPRAGFHAQPPLAFGSRQAHPEQLASLEPVRPLAKLTIAPEDFPFLQQIRGHDDERREELATALQTGAPWPEP